MKICRKVRSSLRMTIIVRVWRNLFKPPEPVLYPGPSGRHL